MQGLLELAERLAARLGVIEGVVAVALGGSVARGAAHPNSDIDLGIYYEPEQRPSVAVLRQLAQELDDYHPTEGVTDYGGWGPWINGGGWLNIEDQRVDWIYRDLAKVRQVISDCQAGKATCDYQPGHPHGFHNHIYLGELFYSRPLYDPNGVLAALKAKIAEYPPRLKETLLRDMLWQARFALATSEKAAARGDVFRVVGGLFQSVACLVQYLFALNERYCINEKGAVQAVESFPLHPEGFGEIVTAVLAHPGSTPDELEGSIQQLEELAVEARLLSYKLDGETDEK